MVVNGLLTAILPFFSLSPLQRHGVSLTSSSTVITLSALDSRWEHQRPGAGQAVCHVRIRYLDGVQIKPMRPDSRAMR